MKSTRKKVIKSKSKDGAVSKSRKAIKNIFDIFNKRKRITVLSSIIILVIITILVLIPIIRKSSLNKVVIKIDDMEYTKSDFMVYFYSVKYDYFGNDIDNATSENMKIVINEETNKTLGEYLKDKTLDELKTASVVKEFASKNNISLTEEDYKELKKEKEKYIDSIGGKRKFNKLLSSNNFTEESYDRMAETDKLYSKILEKLYSKGKRKDLTDEELANARLNYDNRYFKIEQVILTTIDVETRKNLSDTVINQKSVLASAIHDLAVDGNDFEELVRKYSEAALDKEPPYYEYYKSGELLSEIENAIVGLGNDEVSDVIQTNYALHIVKRLELDDSKFDEYLEELREQKALRDIKDSLDSIKIIFHDAYNKINF